jgi:cytochrome d ubiquinol oxidase subunit I
VGNGTGARVLHRFGIPDQEARETHYAIHIPWAMGLIGTRSLTRSIPGIEELETGRNPHPLRHHRL